MFFKLLFEVLPDDRRNLRYQFQKIKLLKHISVEPSPTSVLRVQRIFDINMLYVICHIITWVANRIWFSFG